MIVFLLYLILVIVLEIILYIPLSIFFLSKKMPERLGRIKALKAGSIWFHAASVGEVNAIIPLIKETYGNFPDRDLIITTMTKTGQIAANQLPSAIKKALLPLDLPFCIHNFLNRAKPSIIIIMETEFWPQIFFQAKLRNIPVILVNGRLSLKSLKDYKLTKLFWQYPFKAIKMINAQSKYDKVKFQQLGFTEVNDCGNLKFSLKPPDVEEISVKNDFKLCSDDFVLVMGSSRPGEEAIIHDIYPVLNQSINNLKIIIVPRHLRRLQEVESIFSDSGYILYSHLSSVDNWNILIVDEMGILTKLYSFADLVIVGGSLADHGGHNPLEAVYYQKPVIMGPYYHSCQNTVDKLKEKNGIVISDVLKLADDIIYLYRNKVIRDSIGTQAKMVLNENSKSLKDNLETIKKFIT